MRVEGHDGALKVWGGGELLGAISDLSWATRRLQTKLSFLWFSWFLHFGAQLGPDNAQHARLLGSFFFARVIKRRNAGQF